MLYYLFSPLEENSLFYLLTFRGLAAAGTALLIMFILGPFFIRFLKTVHAKGQPIRKEGPKSHLKTKQGTPTMGGVLILVAVAVATLLWSNLSNQYVWIVLMVTFGFGVLGFIDDYLKVTKQNTKGVAGKIKLAVQIAISIGACVWVQHNAIQYHETHLAIPFFEDMLINLGWFYIPFVIIVIVGASNAVNLTDGLDGLAIGTIMISAASFALISYYIHDLSLAEQLEITFVPGTGELIIFCASLIGAGLGFLWFNAPPAKVFMGDTGSLAIGGALGTMSVIAKQELIFVIIGGVFVMEAVSVILQVGSFKLRNKRIFKMAPIHHHFEKLGWPETTIVIRFWIIAMILAAIGLTSLKLH